MAKGKTHNRRGTPDSSGMPQGDAPLDELMACYAPRQREAYLKGLGILAQVAVRAHLKRQATVPEELRDGNGEKG